MPRGLARETDREPLDRDVAVAVIVIAGEILGAEFPIARHLPFDDAADHLVTVVLAVRSLEQRTQVELHIGPEVVLEGRRLRIETRPDRAIKNLHPRRN